MIKVGIIGAAHPVAGELLRILINHPDVELAWAFEPSHKGLPVAQLHRGLVGETFLRFTDTIAPDEIDMLFVCSDREGEARRILSQLPDDEIKRLRIVAITPDTLDIAEGSDYVYGLPEANRKPLVRGARHATVPSPQAMAILLALLPLAQNNMIAHTIHATVVKASHPYDLGLLSVFPDTDETEVRRQLTAFEPEFDRAVRIVTVSGGFQRGMMAVVYLKSDATVESVRELYDTFYDDHGFTFVSDNTPDIREIANTNKCMLTIDKVDDQLVVTAVIDDLLKGSAGNAVHVMNLLFGLQERVGLMLKASGR